MALLTRQVYRYRVKPSKTGGTPPPELGKIRRKLPGKLAYPTNDGVDVSTAPIDVTANPKGPPTRRGSTPLDT